MTIPSSKESVASRRIKEVGKIVGINCLDSLIIGNHKFFSLIEKGKSQVTKSGQNAYVAMLFLAAVE